MLNILIFGYYNRNNWGDDVFQYVFNNYIFPDKINYNLIFKNLYDLDNNIDLYKSIDKVIIGGGDIINLDFFNDYKIELFRNYFLGIPIYFVGVGLTYPNLLNLMDFGDYFFMRNNIDYNLVKDRFNENYTMRIPDIAFNLLSEPTLINYNRNNKTHKKIGFCLPNTWFVNNTEETQLLNNIYGIITNLAIDSEIYLISFDTSDNINNSDLILNTKIKEKFKDIHHVYNVQPIKNTMDMIEYYKNLDFVICGRFHSVILSIITQTPFVAIYSNTKIENLRIDLIKETKNELNNCFIKMDTNNNDSPIKIDTNAVFIAIEYIKKNYNKISNVLHNYNNINKSNISLFNKKLCDIINNPIKRLSPPQYIIETYKQNIIKTTISGVLKKLNKTSINDMDYILKGNPIINILPKGALSQNMDSFKRIITEEILWIITGDPYGPYYYGLFDNILKSTFLDQIKWIISDYYEKFYYKSNFNNITIINKNFQNLHRSGWQYIIDNISMKLNNNKTNNSLIIDTYIDKTFHWNKEFYQNKGIIPYKKKWIGFIHHTYSDYNNNYNCLELFKDSVFLESLKTCSCLIIMTEYLTTQIKKSLKDNNINNVDVVTIIHPTEQTDILFEWDLFMNNNNKQLIQVGNWLRNVFGIYKIDLPITSIINEKAILQNRNSENYFPPPLFLDTLFNNFNSIENTSTNVDICRNAFSNMHIKGLYNYIAEMQESVKIIPFLDNDQYDNLLSNNIVFLNLIDASACNTLIECIIRNTPIIINPIPAVVELLGENYPLYYNTFYDISKILDNQSLLKQAYDYLYNMNKTQYKIDTFMSDFTSIITKYFGN